MSPCSYYAASKDVSKTGKAIRCAVAGSVCIDYSMIGALFQLATATAAQGFEYIPYMT